MLSFGHPEKIYPKQSDRISNRLGVYFLLTGNILAFFIGYYYFLRLTFLPHNRAGV